MKLKIIAYNILEGFSDFYKYNMEKVVFHPERLKAAKLLIKKENPDILCLTEALWNVKSYRNIYIDYQKEFNFQYIDIRHSIVLLSKYPITYSKANGAYGPNENGVGLRAKIKIGKKEVNIRIVHPRVSVTEEEKAKFLKDILFESQSPQILLGDFNAFDKEDNYSLEWRKNFKDKVMSNEFYKLDPRNKDIILNNSLSGKAIKAVRKFGLIDTFKAKHKSFDFTIPTDLASKDKSTGVRIDYIFCSSDFKIINSGIIKNQLSEKASDHYPVYAILEI